MVFWGAGFNGTLEKKSVPCQGPDLSLCQQSSVSVMSLRLLSLVRGWSCFPGLQMRKLRLGEAALLSHTPGCVKTSLSPSVPTNPELLPGGVKSHPKS